jgi:hypothetical protein
MDLHDNGKSISGGTQRLQKFAKPGRVVKNNVGQKKSGQWQKENNGVKHNDASGQ